MFFSILLVISDSSDERINVLTCHVQFNVCASVHAWTWGNYFIMYLLIAELKFLKKRVPRLGVYAASSSPIAHSM